MNPNSHTANKTPTPMTDEAVRLANPLALPTLCRKLERKLAEHRDNGRRLMEAADGWKAEAERLRGIEQALEAANATLAKIKVHEAKLIASEQRLHHENIRLRDELAEAKADAEAVRELMSVYNLGGWTDAVAPMKRALKAEADLEVLGDELERIRAKLVLAADDEIMRQESAASEKRRTYEDGLEDAAKSVEEKAGRGMFAFDALDCANSIRALKQCGPQPDGQAPAFQAGTQEFDSPGPLQSAPCVAVPPVLRVLADWEKENGSLAGVLPLEWEDLMSAVAQAAVAESPRESVARLMEYSNHERPGE